MAARASLLASSAVVAIWALHQPRMFDKQVGHRLGRDIVVGVQAELCEIGILANQVGGRVFQLAYQLQKRGSVERRLEVLHDFSGGSGLSGLG